jgi:hypothetical protein
MKLIWNKGLFLTTPLLSYIPFIPFQPAAITLGIVVLINKDYSSKSLIDHEAVHVRQYVELLFVGFVLLYFLFWIKGILTGLNSYESYKSIPFEKEAEDYSHRFQERKWFGWIHYIKNQT